MVPRTVQGHLRRAQALGTTEQSAGRLFCESVSGILNEEIRSGFLDFWALSSRCEHL